MEIPMLSVDLIKLLDEVYPERNPSLDMSEKEVWFDAGRRSVVRSLLILQQQQEEEELRKEMGH